MFENGLLFAILPSGHEEKKKTDTHAQTIPVEPPGRRETLGTRLELWKERLKLLYQWCKGRVILSMCYLITEIVRSSLGSK